MLKRKHSALANSKQKGFTIVELIISIAIIGALSAITLAITNNANITEQRIFEDDTAKIIVQASKWGQGRGYTGLSMSVLCSENYIDSQSICGASNDGTGANPWGGDYVINVNAGSINRFDFKSTNVPTNVGPAVARSQKDYARAAQFTSSSKELLMVFGT